MSKKNMNIEIKINENGKARLKGFTKTNFKYFNLEELHNAIITNLITTKIKKEEKEEFLNAFERMLNKIKEEIEEYIFLNEKFKNSYFWNPPLQAKKRREIEADNKMNFELNNRYISLYLDFYLYISCKNYYVHKKAIINNAERNLSAVKKILKEIELLEKFIKNYKESRFYR